jgi:hypothetical protein
LGPSRKSFPSPVFLQTFQALAIVYSAIRSYALRLGRQEVLNFRVFKPSMRRSPKVLEQERRVEKLIALANRASPTPPADARLREAIEDSDYHTGARDSRSGRVRSARRKTVPAHDLGDGDPKTYEDLVGKVRAKHAREQEATFGYFLRALFTAIARAGAAGPLEPEPLELPHPASFRRLEFEPNGTMRIHDSPLRARFEQLYRDLEGLDATRIRECPDCGALFWAQRNDRVGCSKPCANRLRFSDYYWNHKKSGIRSYRGRDAAITAKLRTRNVPKS